MLQFLVILPPALRGMYIFTELGESNSTQEKSTKNIFKLTKFQFQ